MSGPDPEAVRMPTRCGKCQTPLQMPSSGLLRCIIPDCGQGFSPLQHPDDSLPKNCRMKEPAGRCTTGRGSAGSVKHLAPEIVGEAREKYLPPSAVQRAQAGWVGAVLLQMPVSRFSARQVDGHPAAQPVRVRIRPGRWGGSAAAGPASRCRSRRRCCRIRKRRPCRCRRSNRPP